MNENRILIFSTILLFASAIIFAHFSLKSDCQYEDRIKLTKQIDSLNNSIDSIRYIKDSLHNELFVQTTLSMRYEIALEYLKEENAVCADRYEYILSTKTE